MILVKIITMYRTDRLINPFVITGPRYIIVPGEQCAFVSAPRAQGDGDVEKWHSPR